MGKIRDTDKSRIEPDLVTLALRLGWRFRLRPGNREPILPGSLSRVAIGAGGKPDKEHEHGEANEIHQYDAACGRW